MPRMDPLRNTLDHLALDPAAKDDRRYLVSMLRRLGYTEREIEEALGPEPGRIIEVEYRPGRPAAAAGSFAVVQDEWEEPAEEPMEVGFSVARDPFDPAIAHGWLPVDPVAFEERNPEPWSEQPAQGWYETPDDGSAEADWPVHDETTDWPEDESTQWPEQEAESTQWHEPEAESTQWHEPETESTQWPEPGAEATELPEQAEWQEPLEEQADEPAWAEEGDAAWAEPEGEAAEAAEPEPAWDDTPAEPWAQATEADDAWATPEAAWDADDEAAWAEVGAENEPSDTQAWSQTPEPKLDWAEDYAVTDAPAGAWSPEGNEPFTYGEYTLHTRLVELGPDREQRIYFFAKGEPKSGEPCPLPDGYVVDENDRTGLPFLRRDAPAGSDSCLAITQAGTQCRNPSRDTSKYCAVHHGWRGAKALSEAS